MKKATKILKNAKAFMSLPNHEIEFVDNPTMTEIDELRKLQTGVYVYRGLVKRDSLDASGVIKKDKFFSQSSYMGSRKDGVFIVTSRLIHATNGLEDLQFQVSSLPSSSRKALENIDYKETVEMASLAKARGVPSAFVLQHIGSSIVESRRIGIRHWLFGLHNQISPGYESLFRESMHRLGDGVQLGDIGSQFVPYILNLEDLERDLLRIASSGRNYTRRIIAKRCVELLQRSQVAQ